MAMSAIGLKTNLVAMVKSAVNPFCGGPLLDLPCHPYQSWHASIDWYFIIQKVASRLPFIMAGMFSLNTAIITMSSHPQHRFLPLLDFQVLIAPRKSCLRITPHLVKNSLVGIHWQCPQEKESQSWTRMSLLPPKNFPGLGIDWNDPKACIS